MLSEMPTPTPLRFGLMTTALALLVGGLVQSKVAVADGSRLYAPCITCHQPNAWGSRDGTIPNLAGQQKRYLEKQLSLFRDGDRIDIAMQIVAQHPTFSSPQSRQALATYLSGLEVNPNPIEGPGDHLRIGQEAFTHICAACHGFSGQGDVANRVPRLSGQNYPYLRIQIEAAAALHKDLAPPEMTSALRGMGSQEKAAVADYASRLSKSNILLDSNNTVERK